MPNSMVFQDQMPRGLLPGAVACIFCVCVFARLALGGDDAAVMPPNGRPVSWEMRVTDRAEVSVSYKRAPIISSRYIFWGKEWDWAGPKLATGRTDPDGAKQISGRVKGLHLNVTGSITAPRQNQLRMTWIIRAEKELSSIIGGGIQFNLNLDSPSLGPNPPAPILLPDNRGWHWQIGAGDGLTVEFDRPIAKVYFERGRKSKIRTMFVGERISKGQDTVTMTVTLPEGEALVELVDPYGPVDAANWYKGALRPDLSPVDLSFLNHKPAGKHGFVRAEGDQLVFENGAPVRFWGANLAASAIFATKTKIREQAKRIARLGYNLIRIHHHDSTAWVRRTVIDKNRPDSRHFDPEVMDRLDYWIKNLKDEGIYVWLDLHVGRQFKRGDNIGPGIDEMLAHSQNPERGAQGKGYNYFNERIEDLMKEFNENYLFHVNPYTGLAYKDEPAIMGLLLTNENDLTNHFGNRMLANKNNPYHHKIFDKAVRLFARERGLPYKDTWKTWVPGPSKIFLADREWRWNRRMISHLRSLGVKVPVATTHMWGNMALSGLPPLSAGGLIDVHSYGKEEALSLNPRYADNYISYMATGQIYGMPMSITEWNVPYPSIDRFTAPLYVASIASLQGWDAPMIYNYSQGSFGRKSRPHTWSTYDDPALTGMMPAAALLFRQSHVKESETTHVIKLSRDQLYYANSHPKNMASLRTLVERSKLAFALPDIPELDWDSETVVAEDDVVVVDRLDIDFIAKGQGHVHSDTGELTRSWRHGYQTIDTEQTQAVQGWIGGRIFDLADVSFQIRTSKAAVAVSSLDSAPIARSRRLLITAVGRVVATGNNRMPMLSEPLEGTIRIRAPSGLRLYALAGNGAKWFPPPPDYRQGAYEIMLPVARGTHWFLLE